MTNLKKAQNHISKSICIDTFISELRDPRRVTKGNFKYPLAEIFFLVISAVISGTEDWQGIALFGKEKIDWLRKFLPYKKGTPSHDVLGDLFARIDVLNFESVFIKWINTISEITNGTIIAIDGKTIRGSGDSDIPHSAIHVISAYATNQMLCFGQTVVDKKQNEITAIPELLDMLAIKGGVITIDAMGCQKKIAEKIIKKEADYVLMVKDNQQELKEQVEKLFEHYKESCDEDQTIDSGHGRVESRKCEMIGDLRFLDDKDQWKGLRSIVKISSKRYIKKKEIETSEIRYYITSLRPDSERLNQIIRSHWGIENNLHWRLDVIFNEDKSSKRKDNSAANFNIISKMAMTLIDREKTAKASMGKKRLKAAWNDNYRELLLKS